jgi:hypothetical protein
MFAAPHRFLWLVARSRDLKDHHVLYSTILGELVTNLQSSRAAGHSTSEVVHNTPLSCKLCDGNAHSSVRQQGCRPAGQQGTAGPHRYSTTQHCSQDTLQAV